MYTPSVCDDVSAIVYFKQSGHQVPCRIPLVCLSEAFNKIVDAGIHPRDVFFIDYLGALYYTTYDIYGFKYYRYDLFGGDCD